MEDEGKEKKPGFFKRLHASKKNQILFFVVSMAVIIVMYSNVILLINRQFKIIEYDFNWVFQVDDISESNGKLVINGWAFQLGADAKEGSLEIILRDVDTGKKYFLNTKYYARNDVNDYFLCASDYTESGFEAEISLRKLDLINCTYEVILRPAESKNGYATGVYYSNSEMTYVSPNEYVPLKTEGTDLEKIIADGVLRVYRPDFGMYVYQYDGALYWIADENYDFEEDETTYIEYQLWTTQSDRLPEHRVQWSFDNIGFKFEGNELLEWNTGKYRVARAELPKNYSIRMIETGYYIDSVWIWQNHFLPIYE